MRATVFLGGGRIASALIAGLRLAKYGEPIVVYDRHPRKLQQLRKQHGVTIAKNLPRALEQAQLLIVAVRPESVDSLLREIGEVRRSLHAVSLAAGVPLSRLRARLGSPVRWARAMPSPLCRSGRGLTALAFEPGWPATAKRTITALFAKVGSVLEISESKFDAFTVTYSCSHGYHALETLAEAAAKVGLSRKIALTAAAHALADGVLAWRDAEIPLDALVHEAATPGGIAAASMKAMDDAGYKRAIAAGLTAGIKRARQNARRV
jgi:pyrroline-5-carboxylate reductase